MKTILVNSLSHGGGERIAANIANELSKKERVIIVTLENKQFYKVNSNITLIQLNYNSCVDKILAPFKLKKLVRDNNVEIIQSHLYRSNILNIMSKIIGSKHYVQIVNHGDPFQYKNKGLKGYLFLIFIKLIYPMSDQIIAISDAMNIRIKKLIFFGKNKVKTINNPNDIESILELSFKKSDFQLEEKYFVFMGRLIESKKVHLLIEAVKETKINLVIIGAGPQELQLKDLVKEYKLDSYIFFLGQLKNPFPIIRKAHAFVSASNSEGFPNAIIESLACSIPIIHSDCISGPREILQPMSAVNKTINEGSYEITPYGLLYKTEDLQGLINSIQYINKLSDSHIQVIKHKCLNRAYEFDSNTIVKRYFR